MKFKNKKTNRIIVAEQNFIDNLQDKDDWELVEEIISLDILKQQKIKEIRNKYSNRVKEIQSKYEGFEIESFADQRAEYREWKKDNNSPTPIVDKLAEKYGVDKATFMGFVEANILEIVDIQGTMRTKIAQVQTCATQEELNNIEV